MMVPITFWEIMMKTVSLITISLSLLAGSLPAMAREKPASTHSAPLVVQAKPVVQGSLIIQYGAYPGQVHYVQPVVRPHPAYQPHRPHQRERNRRFHHDSRRYW